MKFTTAQLETLTAQLQTLKRVDPDSETWIALCRLVRSLDVDLQEQLLAGNVRWIRTILFAGRVISPAFYLRHLRRAGDWKTALARVDDEKE